MEIMSIHRLMCRLGMALFIVLVPSLASGPAFSAAPEMDWADVAESVTPATGNITAEKIVDRTTGIGERESFSGSGFIIDPTGEIVTNRHVISSAFRITVVLHDGTALRAKVVALARMVDLAMMKVDAGRLLPVLSLEQGEAVKIGEPVLAVGNPPGIGTSLSSGIIENVQGPPVISPDQVTHLVQQTSLHGHRVAMLVR